MIQSLELEKYWKISKHKQRTQNFINMYVQMAVKWSEWSDHEFVADCWPGSAMTLPQ